MAKKNPAVVVPRTGLIRCSFHSLIIILLVVLVFITVPYYQSRESTRLLLDNGITAKKNNIIGNISMETEDYNNISTSTTTSTPIVILLESRTQNKTSSSVVESLLFSSTPKKKNHRYPILISTIDRETSTRLHSSSTTTKNKNRGISLLPGRRRCDLFSGKWVYDNKSYPLYKDRECSFMFGDLACESYGRKDLKYQSWRWQPHHCDIPRFNAKELLERLRGKRLVFVGDSVNRNQWVSMMCLLESVIPEGLKSMSLDGSLYTFKATEYNATIDFYWAPLLVESNADDPSNHRLTDRIVRIDSIEKHAKHWNDADILVFNSYLWWRIPTVKVLLGSFESPNKVYKEVKNQRCYKKVMTTWSDWLNTHINRTKTQLFFVSMSATHYRAYEWGMPNDQNCLNEIEPIFKEGFWGSESDKKMLRIMEDAIKSLKRKGLNIQMLNITQLSEYRKDAHPSIYRKLWVPLTKEQIASPLSYSDCIHWCLPGVPDVWNELLYAYIVHSHKFSS